MARKTNKPGLVVNAPLSKIHRLESPDGELIEVERLRGGKVRIVLPSRFRLMDRAKSLDKAPPKEV